METDIKSFDLTNLSRKVSIAVSISKTGMFMDKTTSKMYVKCQNDVKESSL